MKHKHIIFCLIAFVCLVQTMPAFAAENQQIVEKTADSTAEGKSDYCLDDFALNLELQQEEKEKAILAREYYQAKMSHNVERAQSLTSNQGREPVAVETIRASQNSVSMTQYPQQASTWCGYAAIKSVLSVVGLYPSQSGIKSAIESASGYVSSDGSLPWYISNYNNISDYPARVYVSGQTGYNYVPFPVAPAGSTTINSSDMIYRVVFTIDQGYGLLMDGISYATGNSHMPNYPAYTVNHWLAIKGYSNNGNTIYLVDPASGSSFVSWGNMVSAYPSIGVTNACAYASARGIVW